MVYVALLRGINIGGRSKVEMPRLKQVFEAAGCQNVVTYINSGNIIFSDERLAAALVPLLEKAILNEFGLAVRIVLRDYPNIHALCKAIPSDWTNDSQQKTDILFLWPELDNPHVIDSVLHDPAVENVLYIDGALVWNVGRENITRGSGAKLVKTDLYQHITVRNVNTVRKLQSLMEKLQST